MRSGPPLVLAMALFSCAGTRPTNLGVHEGRLAPCPSSPNCVSSDARADDARHYVPALALASEPDAAWASTREAVASLPRTEIVTESDRYLHAECTSALLGFVDDLEIHLRPDDGILAVRSASRLGYGDLGVNRARVEDLRRRLVTAGAVRPE